MPVGEMAVRQYDAAHGWFARAELKKGLAGKEDETGFFGLVPAAG